MNTQDFCYWLQGFFELSGEDNLTPQQVKVIKEHLQLAFKKETTETVKKESIDEFLDRMRKGIYSPGVIKPNDLKVTCDAKTVKMGTYPQPNEWYVDPSQNIQNPGSFLICSTGVTPEIKVKLSDSDPIENITHFYNTTKTVVSC
jgi:hypothetical protein